MGNTFEDLGVGVECSRHVERRWRGIRWVIAVVGEEEGGSFDRFD